MNGHTFDPANFDRRLDALMRIAESQSNSIHEMTESIREQGRQLATTGQLVRQMVDGINRLTNTVEVHGEVIDDHEEQLNRIEDRMPEADGPQAPE